MTELPSSFIDRTRRLLGDDYPRFEQALATESPVSIRLNPAKCWPGRPLGEAVPWSQEGYYLPERPAFTFDPCFHAGAYYVQEAASMFLHRVIDQYIHTPVRYLDLCAAPGGKSTFCGRRTRRRWRRRRRGRFSPFSSIQRRGMGRR